MEGYSLKGKEEGTGSSDKDNGQVEDARVGSCHKISITEELVASRKDLPLSSHSCIRGHLQATADPIHLWEDGHTGRERQMEAPPQ